MIETFPKSTIKASQSTSKWENKLSLRGKKCKTKRDAKPQSKMGLKDASE